MHMKIKHFPMLIAATAVLFGGLVCHTAQKPNATHAAPSQAPPPPAKQVKPSKPVVAQKTQPAPKSETSTQARNQASAPARPKSEAKPDTGAELIATVDKEYQAGRDQYNVGDEDGANVHFDRSCSLLLDRSNEM